MGYKQTNVWRGIDGDEACDDGINEVGGVEGEARLHSTTESDVVAK
jgi:hypothetical protein